MFRPACFLLCCAAAWAQPDISVLLEEKTLAALHRFDAGFDGSLGVAAIDLATGRRFSLHGDTVFTQASVIKVPVLVRLFQAAGEGKLRLDGKVTLEPREAVGGSGHLQFALKDGPVTLTIRDLIDKMIADSDNTATNKCIDLAGMDSVNRLLDQLGLPKTRLLRKMMDSAAAGRNDENISTPNEMATLMEMIYRGRFGAEPAGFLRKVHGDMQAGLPLDVEVASKTGELPGVRAQSGIIYLPHRPFVLSIMSGFIDDRASPVAEATRIVYRMFEKLERSNRYGHTVR